MTRKVSLSSITTRATLPALISRATSLIVNDSCEPDSRWTAITTMATAAMINNKVTTNDWFLGFTVPPKDNSTEDYTNMSIPRIAHQKILYISLIYPLYRSGCGIHPYSYSRSSSTGQ